MSFFCEIENTQKDIVSLKYDHAKNSKDLKYFSFFTGFFSWRIYYILKACACFGILYIQYFSNSQIRKISLDTAKKTYDTETVFFKLSHRDLEGQDNGAKSMYTLDYEKQS